MGSGWEKTVRGSLAELRAAGYHIGDDKLLRLKPFGISSFSKAGVRGRFLSEKTYLKLQRVLDVERWYGFERDHDGLAFELAVLHHGEVPWDRVAEAAEKRISSTLTRFNVELHKTMGLSGRSFDERRLPNVAARLAYRYIPRAKVAEDKGARLAHELLAAVFQLMLGTMYRDKKLSARDVTQIIQTLGLTADVADSIANGLAVILNPERGLFAVSSDRNTLLRALAEAAFDKECTHQAMIDLTDIMPIFDRIQNALGLATEHQEFIAGFQDRTEAEVDASRWRHRAHVGVFALMIMLRKDGNARQTIHDIVEKRIDLEADILANVRSLRKDIPLIISLLAKKGRDQ